MSRPCLDRRGKIQNSCVLAHSRCGNDGCYCCKVGTTIDASPRSVKDAPFSLQRQQLVPVQFSRACFSHRGEGVCVFVFHHGKFENPRFQNTQRFPACVVVHERPSPTSEAAEQQHLKAAHYCKGMARNFCSRYFSSRQQ